MKLYIVENHYNNNDLEKLVKTYIKLLYKYDTSWLNSQIVPGTTLDQFVECEVESCQSNPDAYLMDTKETIEDILSDPTITFYVESDLKNLLKIVDKQLGVPGVNKYLVRTESATHSRLHTLLRESKRYK